MGAVHRWWLGSAAGRGDLAPGWPGPPSPGGRSRTRSAVRVALIGPVPPHLGGATPGGVATHQVQLAAGLAAAGLDAPLLATNTCTSPKAWRAVQRDFPLFRLARPDDAFIDYVAAGGPLPTRQNPPFLPPHSPPAARPQVPPQNPLCPHFPAALAPVVHHVTPPR